MTEPAYDDEAPKRAGLRPMHYLVLLAVVVALVIAFVALG